MEGAVVDGAVAEEGDGHLIGLEHLETVSGPGGLKDARADDPAGAHHAGFGSEQVHAAAASLRTAGRAAEELGEQLAGRHALGQGVPMPAVGAEDDVVAAQMRTDAGGDRLLPDVRMAGPVNQPALMRSRQLLFATPDQDHGAIKRQELILAQIGSIDRLASVVIVSLWSSCLTETSRDTSRFHVEHVIQVSDPEDLQQLGMDMPDRESSSDGSDPSLEVDQLGQGRRWRRTEPRSNRARVELQV